MTKTPGKIVDHIKKKKLKKVQQKLEMIEEESGWDTFVHWLFTNWFVALLVLGIAGYWGYNKVNDYIEERRMIAEAQKDLEYAKERTEQALKQIEDFKAALTQARAENARLRREIEKLSPTEKANLIESQIDNLKDKMKLSEEKDLTEKLKDKIYELKVHE